MLVDQAVLALGKEQRLDMLPDFVKARDSRTSLRDTRNLVLGHLPFEEQPGGGEGAREKADLMDKEGQMSAEGTKKLRYGTRKLR